MPRPFAIIRSILFAAVILLSACGEQSDDPMELKVYHISCEQSDLDSIQSHFGENIYIPIKITYKGKTVVARMRIRGDTSREDPKKSIKIKFDSTQVEGLPMVLNLNAEYADKTYIRQYLSTVMMQKSGQISYQTEHVELFINGAFYGLYLQVENMDDDFLVRNGLSPKGNLYKATKDGACLSIHDDFDADWEKKTNKNSDHNDLDRLIHDINTVPDEDFQEFLKSTFHYDELVNIMALNMMLSNSSTYYHNYYLYHDLYEDGKWRLLPWDMDKTLSYYNWMPYTYHRTSSEWESDNALIERAFICKTVFEDVKARVNELHEAHLNNATAIPIIDELQALLQASIPLDSTDKLSSMEEWITLLDSERKYFDEHVVRLQDQFDHFPSSFPVYSSNQVQTGPTTFNWGHSKHPEGKNITYAITYGPDPLLLDTLSTKTVEGITDSTFTFNPPLPEGKYHWKVTANNGRNQVDGFNTKNILEVKRGTPLPAYITGKLTLRKAQSPYVAEQKTIVEKDAELYIEPGVEIHMPQDATIECSGQLIANGTAREPIQFVARNGAKAWQFIALHRSSELALFNNVIIKEGVINCQGKKLVLDSCFQMVAQKDVGQVSGKRIDLIYADHSNISIKNSTFIGNGYGEGMVLFDSEIITENCYFDKVPDAIEYIGCNQGVIRGNYVTNSTDDAIDLNDCNNILIERNILVGNKDKAISIGTEQYGPSKENIVVQNNLLLRNHFGIAIKDSSFAEMRNNTIVANTYGINAYKKREGYKQGGLGIVSNSIFSGNKKTNVYPDELSTLIVDHTLVKEKVLEGKNNLGGDPGFIDPERDNFFLMDGSRCIGAATNGTDLGAFGHRQKLVALAEVHVRSDSLIPTGDYIKIVGHYNMPVDLSLYAIVIDEGGRQKSFTFPIGTILNRFGELYICSNYAKFMSCHEGNEAIGGLPKLKAAPTTISFLAPSGYVIDKFSYKVKKGAQQKLTFRFNGVNDKEVRIWQLNAE